MRDFLKKIPILFLLGLFPFRGAVLSAEQGSASLTLDACISSARKNNEVVKIQQQKINQAEQGVRQTLGAALPELSYSYQSFQRDTAGNTLSANGADSKFFLAQPLFYGSRNREYFKAAKSGRYIEELKLKDTVRKLDSDVALAFFQLAQSESDLKNISETINTMTARKNELTERVRLGKSRESDLYMLDSQIAVLRSNMQKISGDCVQFRETLSFLTGVDAASVRIEDTVPEPSSAGSAEDFISAARSRSDIVAANEAVNARSYLASASKGARLPQIDLNGDLYTSRSSSRSDWDVNLLIGLPIYQGGILGSRVREEASLLEEARISLNLAERELKTEIRQLHAALETSISQAAFLNDAFVKVSRNYDLQLRDYGLGLVNNLDVIQSALTLLDVKINLDRTVLQAKLNKTLLDIAVK